MGCNRDSQSLRDARESDSLFNFPIYKHLLLHTILVVECPIGGGMGGGPNVNRGPQQQSNWNPEIQNVSGLIIIQKI